MRQLDKSQHRSKNYVVARPHRCPKPRERSATLHHGPGRERLRRSRPALGGGVSRGRVTELVGRAGAGKTQGCLTLAAACASRGDAMVYVDTEGSFRAQRCGRSRKLEARPIREELLQRVHVLRPQNREELLAALETGVVEERARQARAALVVVDSVAAAARGARRPWTIGLNR